jgi:hypothetical protein
MAGLVPAIRVFPLMAREKGVDARDKRGHDYGGRFRLIGTRSLDARRFSYANRAIFDQTPAG